MRILPFLIAYAILLSAALYRKGLRDRRPRPPSSRAPAAAGIRVLIVGAAGRTGRLLVTQALQRGHAVTALVRRGTELPVEHAQLRVVEGDVLAPASLDEAVRGQNAVVSALGHKRYFGPTRILSEGTRNLLRAMESHGVRRLVCMTSLGIGDSAGRMGLYYTFFTIPFVLPFYFWDKTRQEQIIAGSSADWVVVRPGLLTNGPRRGAYRHGSGVGSFLWTVRISRADVADFMLNQVTDDGYLGATPGVSW
ncbi:MAG: NAD(P)-dependent oxidoreductase [Thermoanaerobaculia bacterium]